MPTLTLTTLLALENSRVADGVDPPVEPFANWQVPDVPIDGGAAPRTPAAQGAGSEAAGDPTGSSTPTITTLASFTGADGAYPFSGLVADAAGDLFGTTQLGGTNNAGTVFELVDTANGYAAPTTLLNFNGAGNGDAPLGSLLVDSSGNLFGTTSGGGAGGKGTVFELSNTNGTYAGSPTTLATFTGANGATPDGGLMLDANGNLIGTTEDGGASGKGTVFEIADTNGAYAAAPTTLASFTGANGAYPTGALLADANGDLFGTTTGGGANGEGSVFEIPKTAAGYAAAPITVASFSGTASGVDPYGNLIMDANGDLFGTTEEGGASSEGTLFELVKTAGGYAAPITLAKFTGNNGAAPLGNLLIDAKGDLFGTTDTGGYNGYGVVFELPKGSGGYSAYTTTIFNGTASASIPAGRLAADASGDLFGTTYEGGTSNDGTVFEITNAGFIVTPTIGGVPPAESAADNASIDPFSSVTIKDSNANQTETVAVTMSAGANGTFSNLSGGSLSHGVYKITGSAGSVTAALQNLVFTPTAHQVAPDETVTTVFTITDTDSASVSATPATIELNTIATAPRTLLWTGEGTATFNDAQNWDDTTYQNNPALWAQNATDSVVLGAAGLATISIGNSVSYAAANAVIANSPAASGSSLIVSGAGSGFAVAGALTVGQTGAGTLSISQGGTVGAASATLGAGTGADGLLSVQGSGSSFSVSGQVQVGGGGTGELDVLGGATATVGNLVIGGGGATSTGNVDVEGEGSELQVTGSTLAIGAASGGGAVLTIGAGTTLNFNGAIVETGLASFNDNGGTIDPDTVIYSGNANSLTGTLLVQQYIDTAGTNLAGSGITIQDGTATVTSPLVIFGDSIADARQNIANGTGQGVWTIGQGGTLLVNANLVDAGQVIDFSAGDTNSALVIGQVVDGYTAGGNPNTGVPGQDPTIAPGAENLLEAGGFDATIQNYQVGDQILLDGAVATSYAIGANGVLELAFADGGEAQLDFIDNRGHAVTDAILNDAGEQITGEAACYRAGTRIATEHGERAIETLAIGDRVRTLSGASRPIRWIGRRSYSRGLLSGNRNLLPIKISAGALAEALPRRDLWVSPEHALYLDGMLIPARMLANGSSIVCDESVGQITYIHLEFDVHTVIFAEGAPAESFVDDDSRQKFDNAAEYRRLYPASPIGPVRFCAPRVEQGEEVEAVRRRLARRCAIGPTPASVTHWS